ncbi:MAG: outer membrane beta-barrel protein [Terriglobales bacterium]
MQSLRVCCTALATVLVLCLAQPLLWAQSSDAAEVEKRVADLEKQLEVLRSELASLKESKPADTPPAQALTPAAESTTPAASAPRPLAGIESVLHGATLTGLVDTYYAINLNHPKGRTSQYRAFDGPTNQFALNLVTLTLDKQPDPNNSRLGYHLAAGFGQAMNAVNSTDPGGLGFSQYLKEAYFSYLAPAGKGLQVDVGKFVTPHGAEVIETHANWNYSRGLLFSYAIPYYHYGARARYVFNDKYAVTAYLVNGWNNVVDSNSGKTFGVTFAWIPSKKLSIVQNYMVGPERAGTDANWRQLSDTVITFSPAIRLTFVANADYGRGDRIEGLNRPVFWTGGAGYIRYQLNPKLAFSTRYEYYNDHDGFTTGTAQHISEVTGTLERRIAQHLLTRLEYRHDFSNQPTFLRGSTPSNRQSTIAAGLIFLLETGETKQ